MANYWETGMAQKYKGRTQQGKFKRDAEKRGKFAGWGSKIGGLLFGAPGNYFGGEIGGMMSGVDRDDITGDDEDWYMNTRKATGEGIDNIGTNATIDSLKSGNFFGAVGGGLGLGKLNLPGGIQTSIPGGTDMTRNMNFGDLSSFLGGDSSGGTGGDILSRMIGDNAMGGGGRSSMPPNILNSGGGGEDSMLGRVMGNVSQQIPEGMDTNTFLVHKQMFPEQSPQEVAEQRGMSLEEYIQQLMGLG
tara:strand:+ start:3343 stop:4080 length:738 start_codon:yes stop_codon:yes gene_type:complete